jgi:excisionase family DNA binding protein
VIGSHRRSKRPGPGAGSGEGPDAFLTYTTPRTQVAMTAGVDPLVQALMGDLTRLIARAEPVTKLRQASSVHRSDLVAPASRHGLAPVQRTHGAEGAGTRAASGSRWLIGEEVGNLVKGDNEEAVLLRADEVSTLLRIGRTMTFQLIASGELPVVRIGRAVRVPRKQLEAWVLSRTSNRV